MKNFYKILLAFILVFCLGFLVTYLTISTTLDKDTSELRISDIPNTLLKDSTGVS